MLRVDPLYQKLWNEKVSQAIGFVVIAAMLALAIDLVTYNNRILEFVVLILACCIGVALFDTYLRMNNGLYQRRAYERREFARWIRRNAVVLATAVGTG